MFWNEKMCEYDNLRCNIGEEAAFERYTSQVGKLIIASVKDDDSTRLFIRDIFSDSMHKEGWWNTFTISSKPCNKGVYICRIGSVKKDKDGYPIFIVDPLKEIDESILDFYGSRTSRVFSNSDLFIDAFTLPLSISGNYNALIEYVSTLDESIEDHFSTDKICAKIVNLVIDGKITIEEIDILLNKPTERQLETKRIMDMSSDIFLNPGKYEEKYPLLVNAVLKNYKRLGIDFSSYNCIEELYNKYDWSVNVKNEVEPVNGDIFDKIEAYLKFDSGRKAANKAAKAAAKKAKKAAKKA